ncbi:MAG: UPF0262 family protein [Pseudomonadota bacterium]
MRSKPAWEKPADGGYLISIELDETSIARQAPAIEHERNVAIYDLLEMNRFQPDLAARGPYRLQLAVQDGRRLFFHISNEHGNHLMTHILSLTPFRRLIHDYAEICESYFDAIKRLAPSQIETIDMARRAIHNEGATLLSDKLSAKITFDDQTSRRLFTLIFVLHARQ